MAVAAHVSRVAKDYAPHGYSIVEEVVATIKTPAAGTAAEILLLDIVNDSDIYIEDVSLFSVTAIAADNTNRINFLMESVNEGATGVVNLVASDTRAANLNGLAANGIKAMPVLNRYVTASPARAIKWTVTKNADHASTRDLVIGVRLRYRRKA